jgi:hypothetical protein
MNEAGFWLEDGQDPRTTPIMLHALKPGAGGRIVLLAEDGKGVDGTGYLPWLPMEAAA